MIRRLDIVFYIAALAFATAGLPGSATAAGAEQPAQTAAIQESLVRSIVETWTREQIDAGAPIDDSGQTRYEVNVRWQGDILLDNPGEVEFEIRRLSSRPFRGPTVVRVELYVDGSLDRAMAVTVDCRYYRDVVVTTQAMRRHTEITPEALIVEERDITNLKHGFFGGPHELIDMRAARVIGSGEIISRRHAEPIPVVLRGDVVTMEVKTDNMSLLATGEALQDGGVGARIRVKNSVSRKVVFGEVVDSSTVRIGGN